MSTEDHLKAHHPPGLCLGWLWGSGRVAERRARQAAKWLRSLREKSTEHTSQLNIGLLPQDRASCEATETDSSEECCSSDADELHEMLLDCDGYCLVTCWSRVLRGRSTLSVLSQSPGATPGNVRLYTNLAPSQAHRADLLEDLRRPPRDRKRPGRGLPSGWLEAP